RERSVPREVGGNDLRRIRCLAAEPGQQGKVNVDCPYSPERAYWRQIMTARANRLKGEWIGTSAETVRRCDRGIVHGPISGRKPPISHRRQNAVGQKERGTRNHAADQVTLIKSQVPAAKRQRAAFDQRLTGGTQRVFYVEGGLTVTIQRGTAVDELHVGEIQHSILVRLQGGAEPGKAQVAQRVRPAEFNPLAVKIR